MNLRKLLSDSATRASVISIILDDYIEDLAKHISLYELENLFLLADFSFEHFLELIVSKLSPREISQALDAIDVEDIATNLMNSGRAEDVINFKEFREDTIEILISRERYRKEVLKRLLDYLEEEYFDTEDAECIIDAADRFKKMLAVD